MNTEGDVTLRPEVLKFATEIEQTIQRFEENSENKWKSKNVFELYKEFKETVDDAEKDYEDFEWFFQETEIEYLDYIEQFEAELYFIGIASTYLLIRISEIKGKQEA